MALSRRGFVAGLLAPGAAFPIGRSHRPHLAPVHVSADRVIRTSAGLRPYRPSGFVVRGEKLGQKTVIHNYGHGGAGITLSWGTAQLAVEEAAKAGEQIRNCAVIGCGVVGLSTARLLQLRGYRPAIYAREAPPLTTSNVAGGLWEPVTVFQHDRVSAEFRQQFVAAARYAFRRYQSLAGPDYGVRWLPLYNLSQQAFQPPRPDSPNREVESLYPETRDLTKRENPFRAPFVHRRDTMLIEPAIYLNALVRDYLIAGGRIEIREFHDLSELTALPETVLFNCTGLGARKLFDDRELTPVRGQLAFLLPQPEVDYCLVGPNSNYMFPRHDGILLGGSHEEGAEVAAVDPKAETSS